MNKFEIELNNRTYDIILNQLKIIIGNSSSQKYEIINALRKFTNKVPSSEYALQTFQKKAIRFNEKPIDSRMWLYFEVNQYFDITTDLKLGTKSLILKYVESCLSNIEYNDEFETVRLVLATLAEETIKPLLDLNVGNFNLTSNITDLNKKALVKMIECYLQNEDLDCNLADLSLDEVILFQLNLIKKIAQNLIDKQIAVVLDLQSVSKVIYRELLELPNNEFVFLFTNSIMSSTDNIELFACSNEKQFVDFADEVQIKDMIMELPYHIESSDLLSHIIELINQSNSDVLSIVNERQL